MISRPARRVGHFRVKLQAVKTARAVFDGGELRVVRCGHGLEALGIRASLSPCEFQICSDAGRLANSAHARVRHRQRAFAVFAFLARLDFAAQEMGHQLHAVANPQDRHAQLENGRVRQRRLGHKRWTARRTESGPWD